MNITIKQITAFVAVAQSQSYAEACDRIHLSQPALSITIKNLEETLGGALLTRSTRTLALTPEGQAFLPVAQRLLADWNHALGDISNLFSLKKGTLNIASMPFFAGSLLPNIFSNYQSMHPNINIRLHDVVNENVIEETRSGRVELGICFDPGETDDLHFIKLFSEEFIALLPSNNKLAKKKTISWLELFDYPFLTLLQPASLQAYIKETAKDLDIVFSPHIESHQLSTIGRMVSLSLGVAAVPKSCSNQMKEMGAVCLPLKQPIVEKDVGIIYRRRYALSSAAEAMKTCMIDFFDNNNG
ncbi:MAG: LysR family transcriptional regulator [Cellvibrionaceae bacterium]